MNKDKQSRENSRNSAINLEKEGINERKRESYKDKNDAMKKNRSK